MAFSRQDLENYEKGPQKQVDDKLNPFRGATPARAADAAAVAAVAAAVPAEEPGGIDQPSSPSATSSFFFHASSGYRARRPSWRLCVKEVACFGFGEFRGHLSFELGLDGRFTCPFFSFLTGGRFARGF